MHRFYLPPSECQSSLLTLSGPEAHHGINVLRIHERERVVVLDGAGAELLCEVIEANRRRLTVRVMQRNSTPPLPCQVTLLQAMTRGKTMDLIIQKATELGVSRVVPIISERAVAQHGDDHGLGKVEKWEATAIEAIKQCGSPWRPCIETPLTPQAFLVRNERFDLPFVASLQADARHPRQHFDWFFAEHQRKPKAICAWVGPEGDFTPAEMNAIRSAGGLPITLGQHVLRSETAAIYCLSVINYELQSPSE